LNFNIKEYVTKLGPGKDFLVNIFKFVLLIILIPILLISSIIRQLKGAKTEERNSDWTSFKDFGHFRISRLFIAEKDLPEDLDYPEEGGDIYLFKLRSEPVIPALENLYFDLNETETKVGLYLISYNRTGLGMTLWRLDKSTAELTKVKDLMNIYWDLSNEDEDTVRLRGRSKTHGYDYFITENLLPTQNESPC